MVTNNNRVSIWVTSAVVEAIRNALENGYDFKDWTDIDIVLIWKVLSVRMLSQLFMNYANPAKK